MLSIPRPSREPHLLKPNILPCCISHNGPIAITSKHWNPQLLQPANQSPFSQGSLSQSHNHSQNHSQNQSQHHHHTQEQDLARKGEEIWVSYFRGRKLLGRNLDLLGVGYRGVIVQGEKQQQEQEVQEVQDHLEEQGGIGARAVFGRGRSGDEDRADGNEGEEDDDDDDEDEEDEFEIQGNGNGNGNVNGNSEDEEIKLETLHQVARFEQITVWEHDRVPEAREPFSRGVQEWLGFAGVVHGEMEE